MKFPKPIPVNAHFMLLYNQRFYFPGGSPEIIFTPYKILGLSVVQQFKPIQKEV